MFIPLGLNAQDYWRPVKNLQSRALASKQPSGMRFIDLDVKQLRSAIDNGSSMTSARGQSRVTNPTVYFPNENGQLEAFVLVETQVIDPKIARQVPDIKTYKGFSEERSGVTIRATISSRGVNSIMRYGNQLMFMEYEQDSATHKYYNRSDVNRDNYQKFTCGAPEALSPSNQNKGIANGKLGSLQAKITSDQTLRTYRIAVATTATFTADYGGQSGAYNEVVNKINRVNDVFETDLGVTLSLVSTQVSILTDVTTNPFNIGVGTRIAPHPTGQNATTNEIYNVLDGTAGVIASYYNANDYEIGHMFHSLKTADFNAGWTTSAGLLGVVCNDVGQSNMANTNLKAAGFTRAQTDSWIPTDYFDIDVLAHEIGHQFNAQHTFSYQTTLNDKSVEPGSGTTIMSYAGVASPSNVQGHSDPYFHYVTIDQITDFVLNTATCNSSSSITNDVPSVNAGADVAIPQGTAYELKATASDANFPLYYSWEQLDGNKQIVQGNFGPTNTTGAMARSFLPTSTNIRYIPNMNRVVSGTLTKTNPTNDTSFPASSDDWETVSTVSRTLNWGVTVRDRSQSSTNTSGGQVSQDDLTITVVPTAQAFAVTSQNTPGVVWTGGSTETIYWNVAQTTQAPINTSNVNVLLSTDGGLTYTTTITTNAANTGSATITVPNGINTLNGRFKVAAVGNIYFAINSTNFEVRSTNQLPVGNPETIYVMESGTATTTSNGATSVLSNDTDPDSGDSLSTNPGTPGSGPFNGTLTLAPSGTGSFTYVHDGTQTSTDSFTYYPNDGSNNGNLVTVSIVVTNTNDCPVAQNPISFQTAQEDDPDDNIDISNVFVDEEGVMLTYTVSNTNPTLLTATLSGTTIVLDYMDDETGNATITLTANDSGCGATVDSSFGVRVDPQNDTPVGVADSINVLENGTVTVTTLNATSVLANDTDTDTSNASLTATRIMGTGPYNHNGSFALMSDGTFTYIHDGTETTTDTFLYSVFDGTSSAVATVSISIQPVNDCPTVANPMPDQTIDEGNPGITPIDLNTVFADADINPMPNTLSYSATYTSSALGTVTINTSTLTLNLVADEFGTMVVTVTANDGTCSTTQDAFTLRVNDVNDPPVSNPDTIRVSETGTATMTMAMQTSVLTNDFDIEGDALTAVLVSTPTYGTLSLMVSGTFTYVHDGSETTTDSFQYRANDGTIDGNITTVSIQIDPVNDCPVYTGGVINSSYNEDTGSHIDFGAAVTDPDSPNLSYTTTYTNSWLTSVTINPNTGYLEHGGKLNQVGTFTGTTTISDGLCSIEVPYTITYTEVNDCPTVDNPIADITVDEDDPDRWIDIRNTFSDVESPTLNYSVVSTDNTLLSVSTTATSLVIDFLDDQHGSATVVLTTTDGDPNCTVDDAITITVNSVNDAPVTVAEAISVVNGGTATRLNDGVTYSLLDNDSDADGNTIVAIPVTPPVNGTLNLQQNGTFAYVHDGSATTTDVFYYKASDTFLDGNTVSVTIFINNPPVAVTETIAVMESGSATLTTDGNASLLANDTDLDAGDLALLTAILVTPPTHGTITLNANGTFVYNHNGSDQPTDSFTYSANDTKVTGAPVTVSITVTNTNDPPVANDDTIIVALNGTATTLDNGSASLMTNDLDPDGDPLTLTLLSSPTFGSLSLNPGGTFSYVQNGTMNSGDSFTYKLNDGTVDSNNATVNIYLSCSPCTESIIEGGVNGVSFTYTDCLCKTVRVYVPKGKAFTFCHLDGSITVDSGNYTLISSRDCN